MDFSHIIVVAGHYGCGKTNLSINLAHHLAQQGEAVTLVDLDLVNPYFRSSDYREEMEERGIHVISPLYASTNLDIPALSPEINSVFVKPEGHVIIDVGGDDAGAAALGRFAAKIRESGPYEMLYVINRYRVLTSSAAEAAAILPEIEASSRLKATGIVNNSHLLQDTTVQQVLDSVPFANEVAEETGLPIRFTSVLTSIAGGIGDQVGAVFPVDLVVKPLWEQEKE